MTALLLLFLPALAAADGVVAECPDWAVARAGGSCSDPGQVMEHLFRTLSRHAGVSPAPELRTLLSSPSVEAGCVEGGELMVMEGAAGGTPAVSKTCGEGSAARHYVAAAGGLLELAGDCEVRGRTVPREEVLAFALAHELSHLAAGDVMGAELGRRCGAWMRAAGAGGPDAAELTRLRADRTLDETARRRAILQLCLDRNSESLFAFKRRHEAEMDANACNLVHNALPLSSPRAGWCLFRRMETSDRLLGGADYGPASSHPAPAERARAMRRCEEVFGRASASP